MSLQTSPMIFAPILLQLKRIKRRHSFGAIFVLVRPSAHDRAIPRSLRRSAFARAKKKFCLIARVSHASNRSLPLARSLSTVRSCPSPCTSATASARADGLDQARRTTWLRRRRSLGTAGFSGARQGAVQPGRIRSALGRRRRS